jgi:hypothetical protein
MRNKPTLQILLFCKEQTMIPLPKFLGEPTCSHDPYLEPTCSHNPYPSYIKHVDHTEITLISM